MKHPLLSRPFSMTSPASILDFLHTIGRLKVSGDVLPCFLFLMGAMDTRETTKRTGWVRQAVQDPESVADHMYRMSVISFLAPQGLDRDRCIRMALVHDMAESVVGDITPFCGISIEEKFNQEKRAMEDLRTLLSGTSAGQTMMDLWCEYEAGTTPEAQFVKEIDKFEMVLQAFEYEKSQESNLTQFFESTKGCFQTPEIVQWMEELQRRRGGDLEKK